MNLRDPELERAKQLLLIIADYDEKILSDAIRQEFREHGAIKLGNIVQRIEKAVAEKQESAVKDRARIKEQARIKDQARTAIKEDEESMGRSSL